MHRKITALRRVKHKLMHQAAQLRQVADELDRLAAVFARAGADQPEECPGAPDGQAADTET